MTIELFAGIILAVAGLYLLAGFIFAIPFVCRGVQIIDESALGSSWGFRVIIFPGVMIFWPVLLRKWIKVKRVKS